eukprot:TRINITY_DN21038_c0_g1_i1.p1 TRINITY_DN21038_c0_g1~~TRINITY_DN21038_c0_g1_i1.p1  ORF type:complete len:104 (+),score=13.91 TRINITY_DN21038_c0_g1_i1:115-426(+)
MHLGHLHMSKANKPLWKRIGNSCIEGSLIIEFCMYCMYVDLDVIKKIQCFWNPIIPHWPSINISAVSVAYGHSFIVKNKEQKKEQENLIQATFCQGKRQVLLS